MKKIIEKIIEEKNILEVLGDKIFVMIEEIKNQSPTKGESTEKTEKTKKTEKTEKKSVIRIFGDTLKKFFIKGEEECDERIKDHKDLKEIVSNIFLLTHSGKYEVPIFMDGHLFYGVDFKEVFNSTKPNESTLKNPKSLLDTFQPLWTNIDLVSVAKNIVQNNAVALYNNVVSGIDDIQKEIFGDHQKRFLKNILEHITKYLRQ